MAHCLGGFVLALAMAELLADAGGSTGRKRLGGCLQIGLAAQSAGDQGGNGVECAAVAAAYAPRCFCFIGRLKLLK